MSDKSRDYYRILGVRPDATSEEIKEAWIFGVKAFHPDKFATSSQRQQAIAQERTKAVNEAYYILSDATQRANYDREYTQKTRAEYTSSPPPRSTPASEPTKTVSSADTSVKENGAHATRPLFLKFLVGTGLYIAWLIAAAMLVAVARHPYRFYTLLRWICCPIFAYSALAAREKNRLAWVWIFGALAVLYNPISRVHLERSIWTGLNWLTVGMIIVATLVFWED